MFKKYLFRLLTIIFLLLLNYFSNQLFNYLESEFSRPRTLTFELPFPKDIVDKYGIDEDGIKEGRINMENLVNKKCRSWRDLPATGRLFLYCSITSNELIAPSE